jgi:hypothetical protein
MPSAYGSLAASAAYGRRLPRLGRAAYLAAIPLAGLCIAGMVHLLIEASITRTLKEDAATTGQIWANYFSSGFEGLDDVVRTGALTPQQRDFITLTARVSRVSGFRLYDARGRLVLWSSEVERPPANVQLREHGEGAVKAIEAGRSHIDLVADHRTPGLSTSYAGAFVPLLAPDGEVRGVVEIHIDQSQAAMSLKDAFRSFALSIAALVTSLLLMAWVVVSRRSNKAVLATNVFQPIEGQPMSVAVTGTVNPPAVVKPAGFDDRLASAVEDAAQHIPERIAVECHLALGDIAFPFDAEGLSHVVRELIANAAAALSFEDNGLQNAVVLKPRITVATKFSPRGIELSVSDNREQSSNDESRVAALRSALQMQRGGLDVQLQARSNIVTVWWPLTTSEAEAA